MFSRLVLVVPFLVLVASAALAQQTPAPPPHHGDAEVKKLLLLMDRDQNGKVSRDEFLAFMSAEFDRLDINKDGELDVKELTGLQISPKHPGGGSK